MSVTAPGTGEPKPRKDVWFNAVNADLTDVDTRVDAAQATATDHVNDAAGAHPSSAISHGGGTVEGAIDGKLAIASNLLDLASAATARDNLGLGDAATQDAMDLPVSTAQAAADALRVEKATFDANTLLKADTDNTPVALSVGASQIVGRKATGGIVAMTVAELNDLLEAAQVSLMSKVFDRPPPGSWLHPQGTPTTAVTSPPLDSYLGCWIWVFAPTPVVKFGLDVTLAGSAGDTARLALYKKNQGLSTLTRVIAETADLGIGSTGQKEVVVGATLSPGKYAAFVRCPVRAGTPAFRARNTNLSVGHFPSESAELLSDQRGGIHPSQIAEAQNAPFPATLTLTLGTRTHAPLLYLEVGA